MESREEALSSSTSSSLSLSTNSVLDPETSSHTGMQQKRRAGRKKFQERRHPIYKGVRKRNGKWVCELRQPHNKSRIWVGTFACPDMAARAHDIATLALKGDSASLNFPETSRALPRARSSSISDIQRSAMEAAEAFADVKSFASSEKVPEGSRKLFLDEEELFNMPGLLDSMAEGLILTPPAMQKGFKWDEGEEDAVDLTLWSD